MKISNIPTDDGMVVRLHVRGTLLMADDCVTGVSKMPFHLAVVETTNTSPNI
jgi:hypothetical protein